MIGNGDGSLTNLSSKATGQKTSKAGKKTSA
jgi:hypothetical protein